LYFLPSKHFIKWQSSVFKWALDHFGLDIALWKHMFSLKQQCGHLNIDK